MSNAKIWSISQVADNNEMQQLKGKREDQRDKIRLTYKCTLCDLVKQLLIAFVLYACAKRITHSISAPSSSPASTKCLPESAHPIPGFAHLKLEYANTCRNESCLNQGLLHNIKIYTKPSQRAADKTNAAATHPYRSRPSPYPL